MTEVLSTNAAGATCMNWNLRGTCGDGDNFVEFWSEFGSIFEWTLTVAGETVTCEYEFGAEALSSPLKVIFADEMTNTAGGPCVGFDDEGTVTLTNGFDATVDTRDYYTLVDGESWQAGSIYDPNGIWYSDNPSPGTREE